MQSTKTQVQAPVRSLDQRMDALRRANEIRVRRAQLKKDLKNGSARIEEILRNPPGYVETANPAMRHLNPAIQMFFGDRTKHVGGIAGKSRTFATAVMIHPLFLGICDAVLGRPY